MCQSCDSEASRYWQPRKPAGAAAERARGLSRSAAAWGASGSAANGSLAPLSRDSSPTPAAHLIRLLLLLSEHHDSAAFALMP